MIFHEIHSVYYRILSRLLTEAAAAPVSDEKLRKLIREEGFAETGLTLPKKLKSEWPLLCEGKSVLSGVPPVLSTDPERRFLKSCLEDPRVTLFLPKETLAALTKALTDIPPLWEPSDLVYYDRYTDGDPFTDAGYRTHFRLLLSALRNHKKVRLTYRRRDGREKEYEGSLLSLEYSPKDDAFRFRFHITVRPMTLNAAGIISCAVTDLPADDIDDPPEKETVVLEITDKRNSLSRAMLSFSDLQKETEPTENGLYRMTLHYEKDDETEILIRLLAFGPFLRILSPETMREKHQARVRRQCDIFKKI